MCTFYRIMVITVSMILSFTISFCVLAAPAQQTEPPLRIEIMTAQVESTVGAPITWRVTLTPYGQQRISSIELRPGDARTWDWLDGVRSFKALTGTVVLDVSAIPLVSGDLRPILEARYIIGEEVQTQLIVNDTFVHVEPIETRIEAGIIARQGTVRKEDRLPVELWIRNRSPFTLTQVQAHGNGADLAWEAPTSPVDIPPGETFRQMLTPTIKGQHPQPQMRIEYAWTDGDGSSYTQALYVSGDPVVPEESVIGRIPNELLGIIVAVIIGTLPTVISGWVEVRRLRKRQEELNRSHVCGLLQLMILRSEHAADNGVDIDLTSLQTIFEEKELFTVVEEDGLDQDARDLWKTAERHNMGLSLPGGTQRMNELKEAARNLKTKLDRVSSEKNRHQNDR